jgi:hypothetical protein
VYFDPVDVAVWSPWSTDESETLYVVYRWLPYCWVSFLSLETSGFIFFVSFCSRSILHPTRMVHVDEPEIDLERIELEVRLYILTIYSLSYFT